MDVDAERVDCSFLFQLLFVRSILLLRVAVDRWILLRHCICASAKLQFDRAGTMNIESIGRGFIVVTVIVGVTLGIGRHRLAVGKMHYDTHYGAMGDVLIRDLRKD